MSNAAGRADRTVHIREHKAGFIEAIRAQGAGEVWLTHTLEVVTPQVILRTGGFWTLNYGRWTPYERGAYISVYEKRQLARTEIFAEDQLDAALARCAELTALGPAH